MNKRLVKKTFKKFRQMMELKKHSKFTPKQIRLLYSYARNVMTDCFEEVCLLCSKEYSSCSCGE